MSTPRTPLARQAASSDHNGRVELLAKDLNAQGGVYCPSPRADMKIWNTHPKVYLDVGHTGEAKCPYCGTVYRLQAGETFNPRH